MDIKIKVRRPKTRSAPSSRDRSERSHYDPPRYRKLTLPELADIGDYHDTIRQAHATFGGVFDLALIEVLVHTIVETTNRTWIEKLAPLLASHRGVGSAADPARPDPDISTLDDLAVGDVNELLCWAEQKMFTTGVVHGDRRKAAGIELIRQGIHVLRGRVSTPNDMKLQLRTIPA